MIFRDRQEAGRLLAHRLATLKNRPDLIVMGLPRGGVPVAHEVAKALNAPLDVFIVRKLGVPGHEELAMGAVASGGVRILNDEVIRHLNITKEAIDAATLRELGELERRERLYRDNRPMPEIQGKTVIVVDDGLATGSTMKVALAALRRKHPARLIVAVPIAPPETCESLRNDADEIVCAATPESFVAVGAWYRQFDQITDEEVRSLMEATTRVV